jgi:hypothetical protein
MMFIASLRLLVLFVDYILLTYFSFLFWVLRSNRSGLPEDAGLFRRLEIEHNFSCMRSVIGRRKPIRKATRINNFCYPSRNSCPNGLISGRILKTTANCLGYLVDAQQKLIVTLFLLLMRCEGGKSETSHHFHDSKKAPVTATTSS